MARLRVAFAGGRRILQGPCWRVVADVSRGRKLEYVRIPRAPDLVWVAGLCAIAAVTIYALVLDGTPLGMDTATAFYPWYAYLGQSLASGHIPMWNPYQFAGTPFAADPESGWAYLPAMLLFSLLPLTQAANAFLLLHVLLASLATYVLARSLGIQPVGALASAIAYSYSGF